jgi:hypothetical protein
MGSSQLSDATPSTAAFAAAVALMPLPLVNTGKSSTLLDLAALLR